MMEYGSNIMVRISRNASKKRFSWENLLSNRLFGYSYVLKDHNDTAIAQFNLATFNNCLSFSFYNFPNKGLLYFLADTESDTDSYSGKLMIIPGILL